MATSITCSYIWGISPAARALAWHARGHRFDSGILHKLIYPMSFYTYILYSSDADKYYTGHTESLEGRVDSHQRGISPYTSSRAKDWKLAYFEEFETRKEAIQRELEIKRKKSRKYIEWLISTKGN